MNKIKSIETLTDRIARQELTDRSTRSRICLKCNGSGEGMYGGTKCEKCKGKGCADESY